MEQRRTEKRNREFVISVIEILGIVAIVWSIWLAFGDAAALGASGIWLLIIAAVTSRRR
jgi:hypothetical protein